MTTYVRTLSRWLLRLALPLTLPLGTLLLTAPPAKAQTSCQFVLGFQTLHDIDPTDIGDCTDNQAYATNGDARQHTTKGLMAWRKADNWTAFTNGYMTWINGPNGLVSRLNTERFPWEAGTPQQPQAAPSTTQPAAPNVQAACPAATVNVVNALHQAGLSGDLQTLFTGLCGQKSLADGSKGFYCYQWAGFQDAANAAHLPITNAAQIEAAVKAGRPGDVPVAQVNLVGPFNNFYAACMTSPVPPSGPVYVSPPPPPPVSVTCTTTPGIYGGPSTTNCF